MKATEAVPAAVGSGEAAWQTEHYSRRVISGSAEEIRANLAFALKQLDYFLESEKPPLLARRKTQLSAYAGKLIAGDVLPFVKRLQISFTPLTENSTIADFGYGIMNSAVTKGDRRTIECEIDALIALGAWRKLQIICSACGTNNTNDTRFCRVCGIPSAASEPAELEVLRLTAAARAAYQKIAGGIIFTVCSTILLLPLWLLSRQDAIVSAVLLGGGALSGLLWSLYGIIRLHRALNPFTEAPKKLAATDSSPPIPAARIDLPARSALVSVTERTTNLLNPLIEKLPVDEDRKTNEFQ